MRHSSIAVAVLAVVLLAGCGGTGGGAPASTTATTVGQVPAGSLAASVASQSDASSDAAGQTSLVASFTANFPIDARSAVFAFTLATKTVTHRVPIPAGCGAISPCSVTVSAPAGANESVQALLYASANGTGTALAVGSGTVSFFAGQPSSFAFALNGIMASFTISLDPSSATMGLDTPISVTVNPFDAAGEALAAGYVNTSLSPPNFSLSVSDPTGYSGSYSGLGSGPITYTEQASGYPAATATLQLNAAPTFKEGFALIFAPEYNFILVDIYPPGGGAAPAREYYLTPRASAHFNPDGALCGIDSIRIRPDANIFPQEFPADPLLAFDLSDNAYVSDPITNAVDVYHGKKFLRQILTPDAPVGVAVDRTGNVYVGTNFGIYEYGPKGSGSISPIAVNTTVSGTPATDAAGNVYAVYGGIGVWQAGTFGPSAPQRVISGGSGSIYDFGVDPAGGVYVVAFVLQPIATTFIQFAPPGSSTFTQLPFKVPHFPISYYYYFPHIAVPLR